MDWKNKHQVIANKIKSQLHARGHDTLKALHNYFVEFDADRSGALDRVEFEKFMSKSGAYLTTQQLRNLYDNFDLNKDGKLVFPELLSSLRSDMNPRRLAAVKDAWNQINPKHQAKLSLDSLQAKFFAAGHPRVKSRQKTAKQVVQQFLEGMQIHAEGGYLSEKGFLDFYGDLNALLPETHDDYFCNTLLDTWGISASAGSITPEFMSKIETYVYQKIRQRTHGVQDEGRTAKKYFRFFDTNESGVLEYDEYCKALAAAGAELRPHELRALFDKYDKDKSGKMDYDQFAAFLLAQSSGKPLHLSATMAMTKKPPVDVLAKVRKELLKRGAHGIRGLGIVFRRMDDSGNRKLDRHEFQWGIKENGHNLSRAEFERLFKFFDKNCDGTVDYNEFLRGVRGELNENRRQMVKLAFKKLDRTGDGLVTLADIQLCYSVQQHPDFKAGRKTKNEILSEFMSQWDRSKKDGIVTLAEFEDYYTDLSASVDRDDQFELIIRNAWHIAGGEGQAANTTIPRHLVTDADGKQRVVMAKGSETFSYDDSIKKFYGAEI